MPVLAPGMRQLNLAFPGDLIDAARAGLPAGRSLTGEIERFLHQLAGRKPPKTPRKRGGKRSLGKSRKT